jgi:hypothetical protein
MRIGRKVKRVFNPKRWIKPVELPQRSEPQRERELVPVRREGDREQTNAS